ncbi:MFS transporter [Oceanobacillus sp. CFH 90083]|uniref:MFS transporter n=1 Tax=Oceanobacillus sp. CFH 90083 TaxID=2592336 RepID=UPI00128C95E4|nr:MFS transporter [Oceanobacillus sp. CFH 90083]
MDRLWTKSYILLLVGMFFLFTGFYMFYPTLPLYIKELGGNASHVGLAMGIFMFSGMVCRALIGGLSDRYGRKIFIVSGLVLFIIITCLYQWTAGIFYLLILRVFHGMSWGTTATSIHIIFADMIPANRRGEGLGWTGVAMTLAMAVGPMIGFAVMDYFSFSALLYLIIILAAITLIISVFIKLPFEVKQKQGVIHFFEKSVFPVTLTVFFLYVSYGGITIFVPLFSETVDVNPATFFLIYAITLLGSRPILGKFSDRYGGKVIIIPALAASAIALIVLGYATNNFMMSLAAILYGLGFGGANPALQATIIRMVPKERIGVATASFGTSTDLGIGLGAIILGWVARYTDYTILFAICAFSVILSFLTFTILVRRRLKD